MEQDASDVLEKYFLALHESLEEEAPTTEDQEACLRSQKYLLSKIKVPLTLRRTLHAAVERAKQAEPGEALRVWGRELGALGKTLAAEAEVDVDQSATLTKAAKALKVPRGALPRADRLDPVVEVMRLGGIPLCEVMSLFASVAPGAVSAPRISLAAFSVFHDSVDARRSTSPEVAPLEAIETEFRYLLTKRHLEHLAGEWA